MRPVVACCVRIPRLGSSSRRGTGGGLKPCGELHGEARPSTKTRHAGWIAFVSGRWQQFLAAPRPPGATEVGGTMLRDGREMIGRCIPIGVRTLALGLIMAMVSAAFVAVEGASSASYHIIAPSGT